MSRPVVVLAGGLSLIFTLVGTRYAIRFFTRQGFGQPIRDDGPTTHHVKRGTPTMGGAVVVLATVVGYAAAKVFTGQAPTASARSCPSSPRGPRPRRRSRARCVPPTMHEPPPKS